MDVDNELTDGRSQCGNDVDMEQSLLQQFSCLGTTDKEELVKQLQKLLGSQLNETTASFFLDMNNWNLQAAICSYFDVDAPYKLPSMALVPNPLLNETENVEPNTWFKKTWQIYNNGGERWPLGCVFQFSAGDNLSTDTRIPINCLAPGESTNITLELLSPAKPGIYQSKYRMCTSSGSYFGDPIWAIITVVEQGTIALTQQLSHFNELGSSHNPVVSINPFAPTRPQYVTEKENETTTLDQDSKMC